jgi:hypothetical protein
MKAELVIATKNQSKYQSVRALIGLVTGEIDFNISQISNKVPSIQEDGRTSSENILIKARHYGDYLKKPFVVVDDEIEFFCFDGTLLLSPQEIARTTTLEKRELFYKIQEMLTKNRIKMVRTRRFIFASEGRFYKRSCEFRSFLEPLSQKEKETVEHKRLEDNILNYFSKPDGVAQRLYQLSLESRTPIVYNEHARSKIKSILRKIKK